MVRVSRTHINEKYQTLNHSYKP